MAPKVDPARAAAWAKIKSNRNRNLVLSMIRDLEPLFGEWEYAQAITACGDVGDPRRAHALLSEMRRPSIFCFNACIKAHGRAGEWREALKLLDKMGDYHMEPTPHSFSAALSALDKAGECDRAIKLLRKIDQPDGFCYSPCIHVLGTKGRTDEAMALLEEALRKRVAKNVGCFNSCARRAHAHEIGHAHAPTHARALACTERSRAPSGHAHVHERSSVPRTHDGRRRSSQQQDVVLTWKG
jgi:pentatricopeptide repeat protein